jgi:hypothetical protein
VQVSTADYRPPLARLTHYYATDAWSLWMAITDSEPQVKGHWHWYLLGGAIVILAPILFFALGRKPHSTTGGKDAVTENPLESGRQSLRRETDVETCRSALADFNSYLAKNESRRVPPLTDQERATLREHFDLDGGELTEVGANTFTHLDSNYLDMCFLLHDAATALDVEVDSGDRKRRPTPLRQAEAAFAWAVRQVRLDRPDGPTVPAQFVLRRGTGTELERALVFLELLRHVGANDERLPGCLVYCPDRDGDVRLWACGVVVLVDGRPDVYLFDPRLGLPLPGPKGVGIATLAAACSDADVLGQLLTLGYDVTPGQAAKAELRYVCSLSALAPRMELLQDELLQSVAKVRLTVAAKDEISRLTKAAQAQVGTKPPVRPWRDGKASGAGVLRRFLPPDDGGVDESKPISRRERFIIANVPWQAMPPQFLDEASFPPRVGLGQRVRSFFAAPFLQMKLETHHARDELLRGHYEKALRELVDMRKLCRDAEERLTEQGKSQELVEDANKWVREAIRAYAAQQRAGGDPQKLEEASAAIDALWKQARPIFVLLDGTRSWPLRLETTYEFALCKHEQAEHLQLESELNPRDEALAERTVDGWKEAVNVWQQYLDDYRAARSSGAGADSTAAAQLAAASARAAAARTGYASGAAARLLGRARLLSGDPSGAQQIWRQELPLTPLEKVGNAYLVRQAPR